MGINNFMAYMHSFQRGKPEILLMLSQDVVLVHQSPKWGVHSSDSPLNEGLLFFKASNSLSCTPGISSCKDQKSLLPSLLRESVSMPFKEVLIHPFKTRADPCKEEGMAKQIGG